MRRRRITRNTGVIPKMRLVGILFLASFLPSLGLCDGEEPILSLAGALQSYVKQVTESIHTYHYVTREAVKVAPEGPLDLADPKLAHHVRDWANYYWDQTQPGDTGMIRGFYVATDPVVSRDFGKNHWLLYRVELPKGLKYLDMKAVEARDEISSEIAVKLKALGCDETRWHYLIYKSFEPACRKVALKTLKDLDIDLIDYPWQAADYPPCVERPSDAFILLRPDRVPDDRVRIFYAESPHSSEETAEQAMIESFFLRVKPNAAESGTTAPETDPEKYKLWPDLDSKTATDREFRTYLDRHIEGCQSAELTGARVTVGEVLKRVIAVGFVSQM